MATRRDRRPGTAVPLAAPAALIGLGRAWIPADLDTAAPPPNGCRTQAGRTAPQEG
ncbi:hypothetical protein [Streptomyces sp. A1547]|uniref:Uncharacterized protein n=1 Tax=Streptomyces sp. R33 TaxID=3238629 RepID=A0AB39YDP9_9ACTN|nr:hypothetical protein [Streptomyces sp. A1547]